MSSFIPDMAFACLTVSSASSPGSPTMMCPPVMIPRSDVRSTVCREHSKVCPRLISRHNEECLSVQFRQIVKQFVRHAVGSCSNHYSHDSVHAKCLFVHLFQRFNRGVCICIGLEICKILHVGIFPGKEPFAILELFRYAAFSVAV